MSNSFASAFSSSTPLLQTIGNSVDILPDPVSTYPDYDGLHFSDFLHYSHLNEQPWPAELPLISIIDTVNGTTKQELDMGVVLYSCSFVVISIMILSQVL